jgi:hypothetical protein
MKTKRITVNKAAAKKRLVASKKRAGLVFAKHPVLKYLRVIEHKHTGKLIHHRNTSHAALMIVLVLAGFFLYISAEIVSASSSGSVSVGLRVEGPAPSVGAVITSPEDGAKLIDKKYVDVSGTCAANTFVVVSNDNLVAGSTTCSADGLFSVQIQLSLGKNVISALNYDNLNQSGPVTPSVNVFVSNKEDKPGTTEPVITPDENGTIEIPAVPSNPSIIPGVNSSISDCGDYKVGNLPTGGEPHILIVCMPRLFSSDVKQVLGIIVWGGYTPYAVSIDWGDGSEPTLLNVSKPGYYTVEFNYAVPNTYRITSYLKDTKGKSSVVHASIQVSGTTKNNATNNTTANNDIFSLPWFMQSIPLYITVVAITIGFWGGDLFDRHYGSGKKRHHKRKAA